ncbi:MAG: spore coat protein U domain-containing protein [Polaromonas sp.]|nr:spore coat protein U domain-containing protein [Polaromonas sp.]
MKTMFGRLALCLVALLAMGAAMADPNSQTFNVTAQVAQGCVILVKTHMTFGLLNVTSDTAAESQATFAVTCTNGSGAIALTFGSANGNRAGDVSAFKMVKGAGTTAAERLVYTLSKADKAMIAIDKATPFTELVADGSAKSLTINGKIAAAAKKGVMTGTYTDTVTMTATYPVL